MTLDSGRSLLKKNLRIQRVTDKSNYMRVLEKARDVILVN